MYSITITTPQGAHSLGAAQLLDLARLIVREAERDGAASYTATLSELQAKFPGKSRLSVHQVSQYLGTWHYTLTGDKRFRSKLIKPGKSTRYISLANLADYIDGR